MQTNDKPTLWILDQNIDQQMVMDEILSLRYQTLFFEDLGSLCRYQAYSERSPDLLIVSLKSVTSGITDFVEKNIGLKTLALAPFSTDPILTHQLESFFDHTLRYPFSRGQVVQIVANLLEQQDDYLKPRMTRSLDKIRPIPVLSLR